MLARKPGFELYCLPHCGPRIGLFAISHLAVSTFACGAATLYIPLGTTCLPVTTGADFAHAEPHERPEGDAGGGGGGSGPALGSETGNDTYTMFRCEPCHRPRPVFVLCPGILLPSIVG